MRPRLLTTAGIAALAAIALMGGLVVAQPLLAPTPKPLPPTSLGTEAEARASIAASQAREEAYLRDFAARGLDPRALPRLRVAASALLPASLAEAVRNADLIVSGKVSATKFDYRSGEPLTTSRFQVDEVLLERPTALNPGSAVEVVQIGGPTPRPDGTGALLETDVSEVLLAPDAAILLLQWEPQVNAFRPLAGAGIYFIRNGRAEPEHSNRFGAAISGRTPAEVAAAIRKAMP